MNYLDDLRETVLGPMFDGLRQHLLMLDKEESGGDEAKYRMHIQDVNAMLRPLNFIVGVNHFNRHCILPLIEAEKQ